MQNLTIRNVASGDLERCFAIESTAYAGDEAATKAKIEKRIREYPDGFIVLENDREIVGFINSGATHAVDLSNEDFKDLAGHDPDGRHVVILSVAVHPDYQGRGLAGRLMNEFIERMRALGKSHIHLICQAGLIGLYAKFGFVDHGASASDHGGLRWNEMSLCLSEPDRSPTSR